MTGSGVRQEHVRVTSSDCSFSWFPSARVWYQKVKPVPRLPPDLPWTVVGAAIVKFHTPSSKRWSGSSEGAGKGGGGTKLERGTPWVKESRHMESK